MAFPKKVVDLVNLQDQMMTFRVTLVLMPGNWRAYASANGLVWTSVPVDAASAPLVPNNQSGVYCFVIEPGIASHPRAGYLMYVGKTDRSFHERFLEYLNEPNTKKPRPSIMRMMVKWPDHLHFYYAPLPNGTDLKVEEDSLISAYLPPANKQLPANVRQIMGAFQ